jgi:exodeoxyribonuclease VII small subunit
MDMTAMEGLEQLTFEEAVTRLEQIVAAMEGGSLPLDDCLRHFEQAVSLSRYCASKLDAAEKQMAVLSADGVLRPADESGFSGTAGW